MRLGISSWCIFTTLPLSPKDADLKWLPIKTAFLIVITSVSTIRDLHALSLYNDYCRFLLDASEVVLHLNPAFSAQGPIKVPAVPILWVCLTTLSTVQVLAEYIRHTQIIRVTVQHFFCFSPVVWGRPLSKPRCGNFMGLIVIWVHVLRILWT